jgi:acetoin utilization protein AcuC
MSGTAALAADERLAGYDFGAAHPLHPRRLGLGLSLLRACGVLGPADLLGFEPATDADLRRVHDPAYLDALERFSAWPDELEPAEAVRWGFVGDNEPFAGMADAAREIAGATIAAVEAVAEGRAAHAFAPMGGLHHALRAQASGFCLLNDPAIAIARCARERGWRVMYVDVDAHHGDGVQEAFYDDPAVLTVSLHETGRHLWPGTGDIHELGKPPAVGRSVNVPLEPYTGDDGFLEAFDAVVPALAAEFRPDLLVTQNGCDGHVDDPLADLHLTVDGFRGLARRLHQLAHDHCRGRWVATGGGGYAIDHVVPRAWAVLWSELSGRPLPPAMPPPASRSWDDPPVEPVAVAAEVARLNRRTVEALRRLVLPPAW